LFEGVVAVNLSVFVSGLRVELADAEETTRILADHGLSARPWAHVFLVLGESFNGYVVAGRVSTAEGEAEEPAGVEL
jgi:hypothetical protein